MQQPLHDGRYWLKNQKGHLPSFLSFKRTPSREKLVLCSISMHELTKYTSSHHLKKRILAGSFHICSSSSDSWPSRWRALLLHVHLARSSGAPKAVQPRSTPAKTTAALLVKAAVHAEDPYCTSAIATHEYPSKLVSMAHKMHIHTHTYTYTHVHTHTHPLATRLVLSFVQLKPKRQVSRFLVNKSYTTHQ